MLNKIDIMGRLTRNPELRHTASGKSVANFAVAVDRDFEKNQTDFIDVVCWGNTADFVSSYFTKGRMAVVSGRLQIREWTDRDGTKRKASEVVADNVYFGDSKKEDPLAEFTKAHPETVAEDRFAELTDDDGDLPF
jgi:single-strand DNA-binding protein